MRSLDKIGLGWESQPHRRWVGEGCLSMIGWRCQGMRNLDGLRPHGALGTPPSTNGTTPPNGVMDMAAAMHAVMVRVPVCIAMVLMHAVVPLVVLVRPVVRMMEGMMVPFPIGPSGRGTLGGMAHRVMHTMHMELHMVMVLQVPYPEGMVGTGHQVMDMGMDMVMDMAGMVVMAPSLPRGPWAMMRTPTMRAPSMRSLSIDTAT